MRWVGRRESGNVDDRRRASGPVMAGGGIGVIILAVVIALLGGDPRPLLQQANRQGGQVQVGNGEAPPLDPDEERRGKFASVVLADTEDVWNALFAKQNQRYSPPTMVLFTDQVQSACGFAQAASGPFYCPADQSLYLDTTFFRQLDEQLGAPGDFAQAYVIAHEVGHHIQNLEGTTDKLDQIRRRVSQVQYNELSVRLELQADFYAGVCLHHAERSKNILEPGDVEEALNAAAAIGDDTLQKRSGGRVVKETFTHGTSEQRLKWFRLGFETGDLSKGDTFAIDDL
ncbi:MAG: neutral zinc metallopeptidase [Planctomycetaceae bacterium]